MVENGQGAPAPATGGEILQKCGLAGVRADAAQPFLECASGGGRDRVAGALGEDPGRAVRFRGL